MSLRYGLKINNPTASGSRPHVFGFETPRNDGDVLLRVDNDDTQTDPALVVYPDKVDLPNDAEVGGTLTMGRVVLPVGTDLWAE